MTEYPPDRIGDELRAAYAAQRAIPRELPGPAPTDEQLLAWHDAGQGGHFTELGEVLLGDDGMPADVEPSTTTPITMTDLLPAEQKARLDHLLAERDNEETP